LRKNKEQEDFFCLILFFFFPFFKSKEEVFFSFLNLLFKEKEEFFFSTFPFYLISGRKKRLLKTKDFILFFGFLIPEEEVCLRRLFF